MQWYVARTSYARETEVADRVSKRGFPVYVPSMVSRKGLAGPLIPTYVFVAFDIADEYWASINQERGVVKLLPMHLPFPSPIPMAFIDECQSREARGEFDLSTKPRLMLKYKPGDDVRIAHGALAGRQGKFVEQKGDRAQLLMKLFSSMLPTWFPIGHLDVGAEAT